MLGGGRSLGGDFIWVLGGVKVRENQGSIPLSVAAIETYAGKRWEWVSQLEFTFSSPSAQAEEAVCHPLDTDPFPVPSDGSLSICHGFSYKKQWVF